MLYLIDGYNLLFYFAKERRSLEKKRERLISLLNARGKEKHLSLLVIFDGACLDEGEAVRRHKGVLEIVYTAKKQSADDYILDWVSECQTPSQVTVVSSDRELASRCRAYGTRTQEIDPFLCYLMAKKKRKRGEESPSSQESFKDSPAHLERLLKLFEKRLLDDQ